MRWIPFLALSYVALVLQTSLVHAVTFSSGAVGDVYPDLLALTAVFVALFAREGLDAMLAAWVLGLAADLTTLAAIGVMPITYALAAGLVFRMREAFFREGLFARASLTLVFCLVAHPLWITAQAALAWRWGGYGWALVEAILVSMYTAAVAPPIFWFLGKAEPLLFGPPAGRSRR
jgi:rod shape-determining protein MreD